MPELPEVETVRKVLLKRVGGKEIIDVRVIYPKVVENSPLAIELIKKQRINDIKRRGKWLIFELDDYFLLSHLRMEGRYNYRKKDEPLLKHEHITFLLDDQTELRYYDTRKFGRMELVSKKDYAKHPKLQALGPEPTQLTFAYLKERYQKKNLPIKTVLLDQNIFVGVGNIYADEILFLSKINPLKKAKDLTDEEIQKIIANTNFVLMKAIKLGGTTINTYMPEEGISGHFQNELFVHTKKDESCQICQTSISKIKVNGRGTYFCAKCQKK